jgi:Mrp family chromosome partitioning ATPase
MLARRRKAVDRQALITYNQQLQQEFHGDEPLTAEIIVVTSGKGGVGKTTTSASLATGLAMAGKKVASSTSTSACATST